MYERFDDHARQVMVVAGEIAARRLRAKTGVKRAEMVTDVRIQLSDVREALDLCIGSNWQGTFHPALVKRMDRLREKTKGSKKAVSILDLSDGMR
jgi:hypothetical protein